MKIGKTEICKKTKEQQQMKYQKKKKKIKIKHIRRCCMGPEIKSKNFLWHIFKFYFLVEQKKKKKPGRCGRHLQQNDFPISRFLAKILRENKIATKSFSKLYCGRRGLIGSVLAY